MAQLSQISIKLGLFDAFLHKIKKFSKKKCRSTWLTEILSVKVRKQLLKLENLLQKQNEGNSLEELPPISMKLGSFDAFLRKMKESGRKTGTALRSEILCIKVD